MYVQPLQPECCVLQLTEQPLSCCLLWRNLLCWNPPVPLSVFWTQALCVRLAPRRSCSFSVPAPSIPSLCAEAVWGYLHSQQEHGRGAANTEHLEMCVEFVLHSDGFCVSLPGECKGSEGKGPLAYSSTFQCRISYLCASQGLPWHGFLGCNLAGVACLKFLERGVFVTEKKFDF